MMDYIGFPEFGIELNVSKIVFTVFGIDIYFYAICIVLGIVVALIFCKIFGEKFEIKYDFVIECLLGILIFGIIGARIYYILFNLEKYIKKPIDILKIRDGGLAIYGGIIFAGIYLWIKCKKKKINFLDFCDYIVPFVAIAQSIGRWGNFFNKEAYGYKTTSILRMRLYDVTGSYIDVHPTFLYESFFTFLIFIFLINLQKNRKFSGEIFYSYIICYSFIRIFIENLRQDSLMLFNFRISQILSVIFFIIFSVIMIYKNKERR